MKQKNTEISFWSLLSILYLSVIVFLLAGSAAVGLVEGWLEAAVISDLLFRELGSWIFLVGFGAALWLRWRELRRTVTIKQLFGKKALAALIVFGVIASGPWWIPLRLEGESDLGLLMVLYALYLFFAGLFLLVPCFLICSLIKVLAEKETEREELEEAKKY